MKNTGKPYEALTEQVFTRLLAQGNVCAKVERDVILEGRSTNHQIDVTFEFIAGSVSYRTIVQCKDWGSPVKQEQVLAFRSVLEDIRGQPRGIMVSRSGFQEGARRYAEDHGIKLYELREPQDTDWEGLVRGILIDVVVRVPQFDDVRFVWDESAIRAEMSARSMATLNLTFSGHPDEMRIASRGGAELDLSEILNALVPSLGEGAGPHPVRHTFDGPVFVEVPGCAIPQLRATAIEASVRISELHEQITVTLEHMIAFCFRDVLDGSVQFLDAGGRQVTVGRIINAGEAALTLP